MKYLMIPQVYTIIAFGASIFLWSFISAIPLIPPRQGTPLYEIHPLFTFELFFNLSTAILWIFAMLISLYDLREQKMAITKGIAENLFIVTLAIVTIIVGILGGIVYSKPIYIEEPPRPDGIVDLRGIPPPDPVRVANALGVLFCEGIWIVHGLLKALNRLKKFKK